MKIKWKKLKKDDPIFKRGFILSSGPNKLQKYVSYKEKKENKKNLFLEPVGDKNSSREDILNNLIKVLIKNGWKFKNKKKESD